MMIQHPFVLLLKKLLLLTILISALQHLPLIQSTDNDGSQSKIVEADTQQQASPPTPEEAVERPSQHEQQTTTNDGSESEIVETQLKASPLVSEAAEDPLQDQQQNTDSDGSESEIVETVEKDQEASPPISEVAEDPLQNQHQSIDNDGNESEIIETVDTKPKVNKPLSEEADPSQHQKQRKQAQPEEKVSSTSSSCDSNLLDMNTILVVGATGATGRHVVHQLLNQGQKVKVIVRSKERMLEVLTGIDGDKKENTYSSHKNLVITEASLLDLSDAELQKQVQDTKAVVSCLGHTLNAKGLWGKPKRLVTDAVRRLTEAMANGSKSESSSPPSKKFVLMNSDGVSHPDGITDDQRHVTERVVLFLLRHLINPHADNEEAAAHLYSTYPSQQSVLQWTVIRPTDLVDGPVTSYKLFDKQQGSLFGSGEATRANVAKCIVDMILDDKLFEQNKFKMPVLYNEGASPSENKKK